MSAPDFLLLILSSPSGAGKTTLTRTLLGAFPDLRFTSRTRRGRRAPARSDGQDYHFVDRDRFERSSTQGAFLEWAEVHGNLYGTSLAEIERAQADARLRRRSSSTSTTRARGRSARRCRRRRRLHLAAVDGRAPQRASAGARARPKRRCSAASKSRSARSSTTRSSTTSSSTTTSSSAFDQLRAIVWPSAPRRRRADLAETLLRTGAVGQRTATRPIHRSACEHVLAVIGGSGLYDIDGLSGRRGDRGRHAVRRAERRHRPRRTSATRRSSSCRGTAAGTASPPHAINFRANVCALKKLGATHLVSVSAVGSMKEDIAPGRPRRRRPVHRPHQAPRVDVLRRGVVAHVGFADPVCAASRERARGRGASAPARTRPPRRHLRVHRGPAVLDARREPALPVLGRLGHRHDGDARGQARARGRAPYATLALATDYDCWHESEEDVTVEAVARGHAEERRTARQRRSPRSRRPPRPATSQRRTARSRRDHDAPDSHHRRDARDASTGSSATSIGRSMTESRMRSAQSQLAHRRLDRVRRPRHAVGSSFATSSAAPRRTRPLAASSLRAGARRRRRRRRLPRDASRRCCARAASTPPGVERARRQDIPLARPLLAGSREPRRRSTRSSTSSPTSARRFPPPTERAPFVLLGNIHPKLQIDVLEQVRAPQLVVADTMNFWISGEPAALADAPREGRLARHQRRRSARARRGCTTSCRPRARYPQARPEGAHHQARRARRAALRRRRRLLRPGVPARRRVATRRARATRFAGGLVGYLARAGVTPLAIRRGMFYASALASFCVEGIGPERLIAASKADLAQRIERFTKMVDYGGTLEG